MPKKRHQPLYSKPQSTAPASLTGSANTSQARFTAADRSNASSVNERLADLRRAELRRQGGDAQERTLGEFQQAVAPSMPPAIRAILQLPEPAPLRPAIRPRQRGLPPGPAPPRSWLSMSRFGPKPGPQERGMSSVDDDIFEYRILPGMYRPAPGSLVDITLRRFAIDWELNREYYHYYLYSLPSHLRMAMIPYLGIWNDREVTSADLRAILLPPKNLEGHDEDGASEAVPPSPGSRKQDEDFQYLDLSRVLGRSLKIREITELLFPSSRSEDYGTPQDSWEDAPEPTPNPTISRPLLPKLTHFSLAVTPDPSFTSADSSVSQTPVTVSWRQLLSLSTHLHTVTHFSLAYWPVPSLTPNAKLATVSAAGRTVQYGATDPYSHLLDDDWSEAIMVLSRLSRNTYGLEYLDLTGCAGWAPVLMRRAEHDSVDWIGHWGKVTTLVLSPGYKLAPDAQSADRERHVREIGHARAVERHIRGQRQGRGRFITVETGRLSGEFGT